MPDLTSAPSSLLDALQDHLNSLEGNRHFAIIFTVISNSKYLGKRSGTVSPTTPVSQNEAERVIAEEKRRLEEFARQVTDKLTYYFLMRLFFREAQLMVHQLVLLVPLLL